MIAAGRLPPCPAAPSRPTPSRPARRARGRRRSPSPPRARAGRFPRRGSSGRWSGSRARSRRLLKDTRPTFTCFGTRATNFCIAFCAAPRREGLTSAARIDPDTSTSSTTVAWSAGFGDAGPRARDRGRREGEREQEERERQPAPGRPARRRDRGEHLEIRERDGVPRPPPVEPDREERRDRDDREHDQEVRRPEAHGAHSAPTCTIACTSIDSPSLAAAVTTTFFPTTAGSREPVPHRELRRLLRPEGDGLPRADELLVTLARHLRETRLAWPDHDDARPNSSAGPAGVTRADTVERPPPPWVGMHPMSGWNACTRRAVETAWKSA